MSVMSIVLVFRPTDSGALVACCYGGTDMVDWRNMTFLWQSAVSSCYQHISSCNYCTASLGWGRKKYHSLTGRYVWAGPVRETDNKWTEMLRPSVSQSNVTCWTCPAEGLTWLECVAAEYQPGVICIFCQL